ncbi:hypothetical protein D3C86_1000050 [compost metagenome]
MSPPLIPSISKFFKSINCFLRSIELNSTTSFFRFRPVFSFVPALSKPMLMLARLIAPNFKLSSGLRTASSATSTVFWATS